MVIVNYIGKIWIILVTPDFLYNLYDNENKLYRWNSQYTYTINNKYYSGEQQENYHQKRARVNTNILW